MSAPFDWRRRGADNLKACGFAIGIYSLILIAIYTVTAMLASFLALVRNLPMMMVWGALIEPRTP